MTEVGLDLGLRDSYQRVAIVWPVGGHDRSGEAVVAGLGDGATLRLGERDVGRDNADGCCLLYTSPSPRDRG